MALENHGQVLPRDTKRRRIDLRRVARSFWPRELLRDRLNTVFCFHDGMLASERLPWRFGNRQDIDFVRVMYMLEDGNWDRCYVIVVSGDGYHLMEQNWDSAGHLIGLSTVFESDDIQKVAEATKVRLRDTLAYKDREAYTLQIRRLMGTGLRRIQAEGIVKMLQT